MGFIKMSEKEAERLEILKSVSQGKMKCKKAAQMLGISKRQLIRIVARYRQGGPKGILHRNRGKESPRKVAKDKKDSIVQILHSSIFQGFGPSFAAEQLSERYQINVSREWLRKIMAAEGLWKVAKHKDLRLYQRRTRRSQEGELLQVDGSYADWFEGRSAKCCLLVAVDDATGNLQELQFVKHETTEDYFDLMRRYIMKRGRPLAIYSDRHAIFITTRKEGFYEATQFARGMKELDIELIHANTPQAKGRVERANGTLQDRLIKSMRLDGVSSMEEGNAYLEKFREIHNAKYAVRPNNHEDAHRTIPKNMDLERILCVKEKRKLSKQLEVQFDNCIYQLEPENNMRRRMVGQVVLIYKNVSGITIEYEGKSCKWKMYEEFKKSNMTMDRKRIVTFLDEKQCENLRMAK